MKNKIKKTAIDTLDEIKAKILSDKIDLTLFEITYGLDEIESWNGTIKKYSGGKYILLNYYEK